MEYMCCSNIKSLILAIVFLTTFSQLHSESEKVGAVEAEIVSEQTTTAAFKSFLKRSLKSDFPPFFDNSLM